MLKNYAKELITIASVFGLISYTIYVVAAEPVKKPTVVKVAPVPAKKEVAKPVGKEIKKPITTKEIVVTPDSKKDPNRKKPKLKAKYADKK